MFPPDYVDEVFIKKVEELTGVAWCPYPSLSIERLVLSKDVPDKKKIQLIEERRKYYFPSFNNGDDPQHELIELIASEYDIKIDIYSLKEWCDLIVYNNVFRRN